MKITIRKIKAWRLCMALFTIALLLPIEPFLHTIKAEQNMNNAESQLNSAIDKVDKAKAEKDEIQGYLDELILELEEVNTRLAELETKISDTQVELEKTRIELEEAKEKESTQYESMKKRIQYMYEQGESGTLDLIFSSSTVSDMLNSIDHAFSIAEYDQQMLTEYRTTKELITEKEDKIMEDQLALEDLEAELVLKQGEISSLMQETSIKIDEYIEIIADGEDLVAEKLEYIRQIEAEQRERELMAEESRAAEESLAIAESQRQATQSQITPTEDPAASNENNNGQGGDNGTAATADGNQTEPTGQSPQEPTDTTTTTAASGGNPVDGYSDLDMLSAIIECEAGGESYEGKVAVGNVVLNRLSSSRYPNTIFGVISQPSQFAPYTSGRFYIVLYRGASSSCRTAAQAAMNGESYATGCLNFMTKAAAEKYGYTWAFELGGHVFW